MKKAGIIIAALLCACLVCGGFYLVKDRSQSHSGEDMKLTKVQKIIMKDLDNNYPETPRAVVKLYNQIIMAYYGREYSEEEFEKLASQARLLMDDALLENNPEDRYKQAVKNEVTDYKNRSRTIRQTDVCDTNEVQYLTDKSNGDKLAYVTASYFVQEKEEFDKTYQKYVLRQDSEGKWKILNYYQIKGDSSEQDEE